MKKYWGLKKRCLTTVKKTYKSPMLFDLDRFFIMADALIENQNIAVIAMNITMALDWARPDYLQELTEP